MDKAVRELQRARKQYEQSDNHLQPDSELRAARTALLSSADHAVEYASSRGSATSPANTLTSPVADTVDVWLRDVESLSEPSSVRTASSSSYSAGDYLLKEKKTKSKAGAETLSKVCHPVFDWGGCHIGVGIKSNIPSSRPKRKKS